MSLSDDIAKLEDKYQTLLNEVEEAHRNAEYHEMIADDLRHQNADLIAENDILRETIEDEYNEGYAVGRKYCGK